MQGGRPSTARGVTEVFQYVAPHRDSQRKVARLAFVNRRAQSMHIDALVRGDLAQRVPCQRVEAQARPPVREKEVVSDQPAAGFLNGIEGTAPCCRAAGFLSGHF
jgi:hypothetical protein